MPVFSGWTAGDRFAGDRGSDDGARGYREGVHAHGDTPYQGADPYDQRLSCRCDSYVCDSCVTVTRRASRRVEVIRSRSSRA